MTAPAGGPAVTAGVDVAAVDALTRRVVAHQRAGRLPDVAAGLLLGICDDVRGLAVRWDVFGVGSLDAHAVRATVTDYVPTLLGHYLRLPADYATTVPVDATGRTASDVLTTQVGLLAGRIRAISDAASAADTAALLAHEAFLTAKFSPDYTPTLAAPTLHAPTAVPDRAGLSRPLHVHQLPVLLAVLVFVVLAVLTSCLPTTSPHAAGAPSRVAAPTEGTLR